MPIIKHMSGNSVFVFQILNLVKEANPANAVCADCKAKGNLYSFGAPGKKIVDKSLAISFVSQKKNIGCHKKVLC